MRHKAIWIIGVVWMLVAGSVNAEELPRGERILAFDSVIEVHEDASLTVTETITVVARQVRIKRGIYRELPSDIDFDVLEVLRDGTEEPYRIEDNRIYIGEGPPYLSPGKYTYTLRYQVDHHLLFHEEADELQWDVTGRWAFLIDRITARVVVPAEVEQHLLDSGDNRQDYWYRKKSFPTLYETFAIPSKRWWQENNEQARAGIYNDKYVIKFYENSGYRTYFATQPVDSCEACELSAETEKIRGEESWGYGLRLGGNKENSIRFLISGNGRYAILKGLEDSVFRNKAGKWAFSPHIRKGNRANHLKVEQREGRLSFWINGELLERIEESPHFRSRRVGFVVHSNGKSATEIRFDNLRYTKTEEAHSSKTEDVQAPEVATEASPLFFEIADTIKANTSFQIFVKWESGYVERGWRGRLASAERQGQEWGASADRRWQDWWASMELPSWWPDFGFLESWWPDISLPQLTTFDRQTNALILAGVAGSVAAFYLLIWLFWLRDPPKGLPRSRTTPPEGISPAAAHYLANKEYDDLTLVCALTSLASKGFLVLQSLGPKTAYSADYIWAVSKQDDAPSKELSKDEKAVSRLIFSYETTVKLSKDNREHLKNLRSEHEETLQTELDDSHIQSHFRFFWLAIGLYLLAVSGVAWWLHGEPTDLFFVGLLFGIAGMELLFNGISKLNRRSNIPVGEVLATLFFLAWSGAALFTVWKFLSPEVLVFMFVLRLLNRWFCGKNQTYTVEGRKVMDQLEGFREHLLPTPSKATSSLSGTGARRSTAEQWFPYAVALGVEQEWRAAADNSPATPDWLEGVALADLAVFGAALSATVAAATFTPSYGHGGHGGGFGGGGGGGGGDGGGGGGH